MSRVPSEDDFLIDMSKELRSFTKKPVGGWLHIALVTLRRAYAIAATQAEEIIAEQCGEDSEAVSELFNQSVQLAANNPFTFEDVAKKWEAVNEIITARLKDLAERKKVEDAKDLEDVNRMRTAPLPLGFPITSDGATEVTVRDRSILLVGERSPTVKVMRKMARNLQEAKFPLAYLTNEDPRVITGEIQSDSETVVLDLHAWQGSAKTVGSFTGLLNKDVLTCIDSKTVSAVFVEASGLAAPPLYIGQPFELIAAVAHKNINRVCQTTLGALFVHAITWDDNNLPITVSTEEELESYLAGPMFSQFRTFGTILRVHNDGTVCFPQRKKEEASNG